MDRALVNNHTRQFRINLLFLCVAVLLSLYFAQMRFDLNIFYDRATPELLVEGNAPNPYQSRILIPWLVRGLLALPFIPSTAIDALSKGIDFIALLLLLISFRYYLKLLFQSQLISTILAFSLFYALPFNYLYTFWYPYDIPSVLFFTLGLALLYRHNWKWYYPLFIVASLNRETTIFLVFIYVVANVDNTPLRKLFQHSIAQLLIWGAIRLVLVNLTGESARTFQWIFERNIETVLRPAVLLWIPVCGGMSWLLAFLGYWSIKDRFVRRSLLVVIPWLVGMFLVGSIVELRIYGELIPVFLPAALLALREVFSLDPDS